MGEGLSGLRAVLFDLDGVVVDTAKYHYQAWKRIAEEENIYFDEEINERLKGVSRMDSLNILMERRTREYTEKQLEQLADRKNGYYVAFLNQMAAGDILPGVMAFLSELKHCGIKTAICSASKNTDTILERLNISPLFDTVVSGLDVARSKPDPQVFHIAAQRLGVPAEQCLVIEDSAAGIEAAALAGMKSIGIGRKDRLGQAGSVIASTEELCLALTRRLF
ncbi:beta-phosphoglucomutase [Paenibacillus sp. YN15]|uniref:beta-phosphoglucomutase n=1 Tax=Paenibacillus sp. YN15 TaxID=1742774 RepID=UPI000DCB7B8A|nr:beta-phosphoglucomutase [Paenibacillus sp. YN15]RAU98101.1 beta-phosphoglucomutase [Paenibacillus sp. YN15]